MAKLLHRKHAPDMGGRHFWCRKGETGPLNKIRRSKRNARTHSKKQREKLLAILYKDLSQLKPRKGNPRIHTAKQIHQIAASIKEFGFITPILVDDADRIIAGHGRAEAAKLIGMSDVPTVRVDHLTPGRRRRSPAPGPGRRRRSPAPGSHRT
jgi:ParB-like chromosome segregation protein Spo0J